MSTLAFDPEETTHWEQSHPRSIAPEQWEKFEGYAAEMFSAFGMNLDTAGTKTTPFPFVHALLDATHRDQGDPQLLTALPTGCRRRSDCHNSPTIDGTHGFL